MRRRGQQMGDARSELQGRGNAGWQETPEVDGDLRESENEMLADASSQHFGGDSVTPDHVLPSTPAAIPASQPLGQSGGEQVFKQRQKDNADP